MRAIVITKHGGPEVLAIEERPDPEVKAGHILIEVKALASIKLRFTSGAETGRGCSSDRH